MSQGFFSYSESQLDGSSIVLDPADHNCSDYYHYYQNIQNIESHIGLEPYDYE